MLYWETLKVFVVAVLCCVGKSEARLLSDEINFDKAKGMILMGAYGDALGCPTEQECQSGQIWLNKTCELSQYIYSSYHSSEWGVWPNQTLILNSKGVITDDTSFRIK